MYKTWAFTITKSILILQIYIANVKLRFNIYFWTAEREVERLTCRQYANVGVSNVWLQRTLSNISSDEKASLTQSEAIAAQKPAERAKPRLPPRFNILTNNKIRQKKPKLWIEMFCQYVNQSTSYPCSFLPSLLRAKERAWVRGCQQWLSINLPL